MCTIDIPSQVLNNRVLVERNRSKQVAKKYTIVAQQRPKAHSDELLFPQVTVEDCCISTEIGNFLIFCIATVCHSPM